MVVLQGEEAWQRHRDSVQIDNIDDTEDIKQND